MLIILKAMTGFYQHFLWLGAIVCLIAFAVQEDKTIYSNLCMGIILILLALYNGFINFKRIRG